MPTPRLVWQGSAVNSVKMVGIGLRSIQNLNKFFLFCYCGKIKAIVFLMKVIHSTKFVLIDF